MCTLVVHPPAILVQQYHDPMVSVMAEYRYRFSLLVRTWNFGVTHVCRRSERACRITALSRFASASSVFRLKTLGHMHFDCPKLGDDRFRVIFVPCQGLGAFPNMSLIRALFHKIQAGFQGRIKLVQRSRGSPSGLPAEAFSCATTI